MEEREKVKQHVHELCDRRDRPGARYCRVCYTVGVAGAVLRRMSPAEAWMIANSTIAYRFIEFPRLRP